MLFRKRSGLAICLAILICLLAAEVLAAEFTARVRQTFKGRELHGTVAVKGELIRQDMEIEGGAASTIARPDQKVMWLLFPMMKVYMEVPLKSGELKNILTMPQDRSRMKLLGQEKVQGYVTDKYEMPLTVMGKETRAFIWLSPQLGFPLKMALTDGSLTMEYQDIKEGRVSGDLFEVPDGYKKMSMPLLGQ